MDEQYAAIISLAGQLLNLWSCADRLIKGKSPQIPAVTPHEGPRCHTLPWCDLPSNADSICMLLVPVLDGAECWPPCLRAIDGYPTAAGATARGSLEPPAVERLPLAI
jgi:hypothetical protein